jgi:hypothetical protein
MKVKLRGTILQSSSTDGDVHITFNANGDAESAKLNAKPVAMKGTFVMKALAASQIKLGSTLYFTISDEEEK